MDENHGEDENTHLTQEAPVVVCIIFEESLKRATHFDDHAMGYNEEGCCQCREKEISAMNTSDAQHTLKLILHS